MKKSSPRETPLCHMLPEEGGASVYTELRLKLLTGRTQAIRVEPPFRFDDLEYLPGIRAVRLGNLTVLYEGLVYDVQPAAEQT